MPKVSSIGVFYIHNVGWRKRLLKPWPWWPDREAITAETTYENKRNQESRAGRGLPPHAQAHRGSGESDRQATTPQIHRSCIRRGDATYSTTEA